MHSTIYAYLRDTGTCTAPSMHIYADTGTCTALQVRQHGYQFLASTTCLYAWCIYATVYVAQSFPRDCLVKSPHRLEQATLCKKSASMTDESQPEQVKQLVRFQRLPRDIQKRWWHIFYDDKWRRCHKCCTWCMLFSDCDDIHTVMHAHPMIAVVFGAYPVAEDDPEYLCNECTVAEDDSECWSSATWSVSVQ